MYRIKIDTLTKAIQAVNYAHGEDGIVIDRAYPCAQYDTCFAFRCRSATTPARLLGAIATISPEDAVALQQAQQHSTDDEDDRLVYHFPGITVDGPVGEFDESDTTE